jgi:DNA repair photolyase
MATSPILRPSPATFPRRRTRPKQTSLTLFPTAARHGTCESPREASAPTPVPDRRTKPATELVGIARLAASSPCADAKRGTEYFLLPVRSILNHCDSKRVPFRWTVNPYRGCEFGCQYCYARYTHEYMELDGGEFESKIFVKQDVAAIVERDLATEKVWGEHIALGTATDPYQPAEKEFGATRAILEKMAAREGLRLEITTKSNQVVRDIDLLKRISERSSLTVNLSITTPRARLARLLEPRAPQPDLRFEAVRKLHEAGIAAGVFVAPVLPWLTDREEDLDALAQAAREAGAQWFCGYVLFLMPASLKQFLPFLEKKFPELVQRYHKWYGRGGYAPETYRKEVSVRFENLRRKYGLGSRIGGTASQLRQSPQMALGLAP